MKRERKLVQMEKDVRADEEQLGNDLNQKSI